MWGQIAVSLLPFRSLARRAEAAIAATLKIPKHDERCKWDMNENHRIGSLSFAIPNPRALQEFWNETLNKIVDARTATLRVLPNLSVLYIWLVNGHPHQSYVF